MERRNVVTCDIPGASLQANWPEAKDLKFEGLMVKMTCQIDISYKKYALTDKTTGKQRLYGKLTNAVYGMLLGVILFYQKLSGQL